MENLFALAGLGLVIVVGLLFVGFTVARLYKRATKETSFVRTGMGGQRVITDGGAIVIPVLHEITVVNMNTLRLLVTRSNKESLITRDRMRVNVDAEFYVRVKPEANAIAIAAQTLGSKTAAPNELMALVEGKFVDALRSAASAMTMHELQDKRSDFVTKVLEVVSEELSKNGLELETVSLTNLDQTNKEFFNPENAFDAEGLTRLTEQTENRRRDRNKIEQETDVEIKRKNLEATNERLAIAQKERFAILEQEQTVQTREAEQAALIAKQRADRERESEEARIAASLAVENKKIESDREIGLAKVLKEKSLEAAQIEKDKEINIAQQNRSAEIAKSSEALSKAEAEANVARKHAIESELEIQTVTAVADAERAGQVAVVLAQKKAEEAAAGVVISANADRDAAKARAEAKEADATAAANADKIRAEGIKAVASAEAEGKSLINNAANLLSPEQIELQLKLALIKELPSIVREAVKPIEKIDSIKVVDVSGLNGGGSGGDGSSDGGGNGNGSLADSMVNSALRYQAHRPLIENLMQSVGLDGGLESVVNGTATNRMFKKPE